jgi:Domain of unknown function (DUF4157)/Bacterial toxin 28
MGLKFMTRRSITQTQAKSSDTPIQAGLLQRKCTDCGQHTIAGGECTGCAKKKVSLQRKLTIGSSNDPLELEADHIADRVMATPENSTISGTSPRIQRFTGQTNGQADMEAPASVDRVLSSPGRPLEPELQQDMGQRFGHDFSRVRVHTGGEAARSAQDVNANAYTVGRNIVFGSGQFKPETHRGRRLVAHELTHVVQQSGEAVQRVLSLSSDICLQRSPVSVAVKQGAKFAAKKAIKEFIENQIKSRLRQYMSKQFAKQFIKDADDILNILDSSWWEIGLELIPIAGDIYGAGSFAKKLDKLWDKVKKLEKQVQLVTTVASKAIRKIVFNPKLTGRGKEKLEIFVNKLNRLSDHLTDDDLAGAAKDILGNPVIIGGKQYNHLQEVNNALKGLGNQLDTLKDGINKLEFEGDTLNEANRLLSTLSKQKDEIQNVLAKVKNEI